MLIEAKRIQAIAERIATTRFGHQIYSDGCMWFPNLPELLLGVLRDAAMGRDPETLQPLSCHKQSSHVEDEEHGALKTRFPLTLGTGCLSTV